MYFFKFLGWFWSKHLKNVDQRVGFTAAALAVGCVPVSLSVYFFGPIALAWYFGSIGVSFLIFLIYLFFSFIHRAYVKWQAQVFDKLRNGHEQQESSW